MPSWQDEDDGYTHRTWSSVNGIALPIDPIIGQLGHAPAAEVTNAPNPSLQLGTQSATSCWKRKIADRLADR